MKKINAAITIVTILVVPMFLVGCAAVDDIWRATTKLVTNTSDNVPPVSSVKPPVRGQQNRPGVVTVVSNNVDQNMLKKCSQQAGKSAVVEAWQQRNYSGRKIPENYLLSVARDAIQRCTVGKVGDEILDELAYSVVSDFREEYPQAKLD